MFSLNRLLNFDLVVSTSEWQDGIREILKSPYQIIHRDYKTYTLYVPIDDQIWACVGMSGGSRPWSGHFCIYQPEENPYRVWNVNPRGYCSPLEPLDKVADPRERFEILDFDADTNDRMLLN